jgi:uncharacterized protein YcfJ
MKKIQSTVTIATILLILAGCSSRPRNFAPILAPPPVAEDQLARDFGTCVDLVKKGRTSDFKAVAGVTIGGVAGGLVGSVATGSLGAAAGAGFTTSLSAATVALPIFGIGIGFGISRAIRSSREKKLKALLTKCLNEYGYSVSGWVVVPKVKKQKATPAQTAAPSQPEQTTLVLFSKTA